MEKIRRDGARKGVKKMGGMWDGQERRKRRKEGRLRIYIKWQILLSWEGRNSGFEVG